MCGAFEDRMCVIFVEILCVWCFWGSYVCGVCEDLICVMFVGIFYV